MIVFRSVFFGFGVAASWGNVELAADDRLDPMLLSIFIEFNGPTEIAVIGERQRGHLLLHALFHQLFGAAHRIEQTILRMDVQVHKRAHRSSSPSSISI
jgi:hypothetical protein